jgi:hypothetical protein
VSDTLAHSLLLVARANTAHKHSQHSQSLARALQRPRLPPPSVKSPSVTKKLLAELCRLRKDTLASANALKALQHEAQLSRTVFKARVSVATRSSRM